MLKSKNWKVRVIINIKTLFEKRVWIIRRQIRKVCQLAPFGQMIDPSRIDCFDSWNAVDH